MNAAPPLLHEADNRISLLRHQNRKTGPGEPLRLPAYL